MLTTALFGVRSFQLVRANPVAAIKPRRTRLTAAGLACVVGTAVLAFASITLAQPAGENTRSGLGGLQPEPPVSAIQAPNVKVPTKRTAAAFDYYNIPAAAFQPLSSVATYVNDFTGCMYATTAGFPGGVRFVAPIFLPSGSIIRQLLFYWYDASVGDMNLLLVKQPPGGQADYPVELLSEGTAGNGSTVSGPFEVVVDPQNYSYSLVWTPSFYNDGQRICGARIVYYPPAPTAALCSLDADGNGAIDALSDGLIIMRAMFGLTGTAVTSNAIGSGTPSRTTWAQLRDFFNTSCGANFAQ